MLGIFSNVFRIASRTEPQNSQNKTEDYYSQMRRYRNAEKAERDQARRRLDRAYLQTFW
ncbi:hypothetical protein GCM10008927_10550 [Amylibacter ulvae]|uniref:Uncharacterized protein n=1 Tax=Paramylibacter ulvae TaxID=1651968 RepID=A0ABQ3CWP7_9RHOB|nr:hypothetical protein [Amylibacter ulvae]GHA47614.1 hypothetical protein GCM10008927_10550 [Amylibacter ulvae]